MYVAQFTHWYHVVHGCVEAQPIAINRENRFCKAFKSDTRVIILVLNSGEIK